MERIGNADEYREEPLRCPECGGVLGLRLLEVGDDDGGEGELLLLLDCPRNDFRTTVTYTDLAAALAAEVTGRLSANRGSRVP